MDQQLLQRFIDYAASPPEAPLELTLPIPFDVASAAVRKHTTINMRDRAIRKKLWPFVPSCEEENVLGACTYTLYSFNLYAMSRPRYDAQAPREKLGFITLRKLRNNPAPLTEMCISEMPEVQPEEIPGATIAFDDGDVIYLEEQADTEAARKEYKERMQRTKERNDLRQKMLSHFFQALSTEWPFLIGYTRSQSQPATNGHEHPELPGTVRMFDIYPTSPISKELQSTTDILTKHKRKRPAKNQRILDRERVILEIYEQNPEWNYDRIALEAQKIANDEDIDDETVRNTLRNYGISKMKANRIR